MAAKLRFYASTTAVEGPSREDRLIVKSGGELVKDVLGGLSTGLAVEHGRVRERRPLVEGAAVERASRLTFWHPRTGFHVASVHSILLCLLTAQNLTRSSGCSTRRGRRSRKDGRLGRSRRGARSGCRRRRSCRAPPRPSRPRRYPGLPCNKRLARTRDKRRGAPSRCSLRGGSSDRDGPRLLCR